MDQTRAGKRVRFGIQTRVLALAVLFTLLAAAVVTAGSARNLSAQLRRASFQSAEYASRPPPSASARTFWRSTPCQAGAP